MKILWASPNLLHPTTKGGQIRTLEMLRVLNRRHEIHYVTFVDEDNQTTAEGLRRSSEYCSRLHTVPRRLVSKRSPGFVWQLAAGLFAERPVNIERYYFPAMRQLIAGLLENESFDRAVCDFLATAAHFPDLGRCLFFPHNVETLIWRRLRDTAPDPVRRWYFGGQAERMDRYEGSVARQSGHIVAVSPQEAAHFRDLFGARRAIDIPTGVNLDYFTPPAPLPEGPRHDLVFVGSMDYLPNIEGITWFLREIWPQIRARRPQTTLAVVGRDPTPAIRSLASEAGGVTVTGTVPDVRPYLWGAALSVVPLRVGGGTRLKVYESMGARTPVVSTTVGAEGLAIDPPHDIRLADSAPDFAAEVVALLEDRAQRESLAERAWQMVEARFTWPRIADRFEEILFDSPAARAEAEAPHVPR